MAQGMVVITSQPGANAPDPLRGLRRFCPGSWALEAVRVLQLGSGAGCGAG
jgi:hypothetical protein